MASYQSSNTTDAASFNHPEAWLIMGKFIKLSRSFCIAAENFHAAGRLTGNIQ
jgi:hypothetical protein